MFTYVLKPNTTYDSGSSGNWLEGISSDNWLWFVFAQDSRCFNILSSLTFTTLVSKFIIHTLIYDIRYATYFNNTKKNVVKTFKQWPIWWKCTNYFNLPLLLYFENLCHFLPLVLNLLPLLLHVIQKTCIHNIYECLPIVLLKWLVIVFWIFVFNEVKH